MWLCSSDTSHCIEEDTIVNFDNCIKFLHFSILKTSVSYIMKYFFLDIREFKYIDNERFYQISIFLTIFFYPDMLSIFCNLFNKGRNTI